MQMINIGLQATNRNLIVDSGKTPAPEEPAPPETNIEDSLTLTREFPVGATIGSGDVARDKNAIFAIDFVALDGANGGLIYEQGAGVIGSHIGFRSDGRFIARIGKGESLPLPNAAALFIPSGTIKGDGTLIASFELGAHLKVRVWWNNALLGEAISSEPNELWAGTDSGSFLRTSRNTTNDEMATIVSYQNASNMRYYESQTIQ